MSEEDFKDAGSEFDEGANDNEDYDDAEDDSGDETFEDEES